MLLGIVAALEALADNGDSLSGLRQGNRGRFRPRARAAQKIDRRRFVRRGRVTASINEPFTSIVGNTCHSTKTGFLSTEEDRGSTNSILPACEHQPVMHSPALPPQAVATSTSPA